MVNPVKGEVPLELSDGTKLTLVFDMEALIEAESAYGKPMHTVLIDASSGFMGAIRAMLYGALRAHHADVSLKDISAMLADNTEAIGDALGRAYEAAMPTGSKTSTEGKARSQAGKTSGASGAKRSSSRKPSGG